MLFPVRQEDLSKSIFTSPFGLRGGGIHRGIDISMPVGTPLIAPLDGRVVYNRINSGGVTQGYGYYLALYHEDKKLYTLYGHLRELPRIKVGDMVKAGEVVAHSGATGDATGPHLHYEIHEGGLLFTSQVQAKDTAVDPVKYYPQLANYVGKNLGGINLPTIEGEEISEKVRFRQQWQEDLFIATIIDLGKRGVLNNTGDWLKKYRDGNLTVSELGLLALVVADRD